jgi:hypothetical protein
MATTTRNHILNADRYQFDFGACSAGNGWAQLDTTRDASYYGTWVHPTRLLIFGYCEGDTTLTTCDDEEDFKTELRRVVDGLKEAGSFKGIDPGLKPERAAAFCRLGFGDCLHDCPWYWVLEDPKYGGQNAPSTEGANDE